MTDLDKLIEAVEAGSLSEFHEPGQFKALPFKFWSRAASAYRGSLDAAKALHDSLLPGWCDYGVSKTWATVDSGTEGTWDAKVQDDNPARAWLLVILKAYRAQQEGGKK